MYTIRKEEIAEFNCLVKRFCKLPLTKQESSSFPTIPLSVQLSDLLDWISTCIKSHIENVENSLSEGRKLAEGFIIRYLTHLYQTARLNPIDKEMAIDFYEQIGLYFPLEMRTIPSGDLKGIILKSLYDNARVNYLSLLKEGSESIRKDTKSVNLVVQRKLNFDDPLRTPPRAAPAVMTKTPQKTSTNVPSPPKLSRWQRCKKKIIGATCLCIGLVTAAVGAILTLTGIGAPIGIMLEGIGSKMLISGYAAIVGPTAVSGINAAIGAGVNALGCVMLGEAAVGAPVAAVASHEKRVADRKMVKSIGVSGLQRVYILERVKRMKQKTTSPVNKQEIGLLEQLGSMLESERKPLSFCRRNQLFKEPPRKETRKFLCGLTALEARHLKIRSRKLLGIA